MKFALGKKLGMTTIYNEDGAQNVTILEVGDQSVDMVRTMEKDGYQAVRVAADKRLCEFRTDAEMEVGKALDVSQFEVGDKVLVSGVTKGKGFQGVVKRHGFKGGPASHGHRHVLRRPGSIGSAFPQHVIKGKRMAGRMGGERFTTKGLKVISVDAQNKTIAVKGAVPGVNGRNIEIVSA